MICPKCKTQMEKGYLGSHGTRWLAEQMGSLAKIAFFGSLVYAWKCPQCKYVELRSE
ncbi:MAG: PF20097 family protein [bacterium]|nr:PF20097 family protein [bacterium]